MSIYSKNEACQKIFLTAMYANIPLYTSIFTYDIIYDIYHFTTGQSHYRGIISTSSNYFKLFLLKVISLLAISAGTSIGGYLFGPNYAFIGAIGFDFLTMPLAGLIM